MRQITLFSISCLFACALLASPAQALVTSVTTSTSTISQLTDYVSPTAVFYDSVDPTISKDGSTIVFVSSADLIPGLNPDHLFNIFIMNSDGSDLRQLTSAVVPDTPVDYTTVDDSTRTPPRPSADGKVIVFASYYDLTGENPPVKIPNLDNDAFSIYQRYFQIFIINSDGTGLRQLTHGTDGHSTKPRISDDGSIIAFESSQDLITGQNSDHTGEIFVINADGTGLTQITNGELHPRDGRGIRSSDSRNVAISGDGTTIAFDSFNDLLAPKNDDWSNEIFVFDLAKYKGDGASLNDLASYTVQVTDTDVDAEFHIRAEDSFEPSLPHDGSVVVFSACINPGGEGIGNPDRTILGDNPFLPDVIYLANRDGSGLRQLTFSDDPDAYANDPNWRNINDDAHWPEISDDGTKIVFGTRSKADLTPGSGYYEIAMIDLTAPLDHDGRPVVEQLTTQVRPAVTQLTFLSTDSSRLRPSINADASLITLSTYSDLTGSNSNADESREIFLVEPTVTTPDPPTETTDDDTTDTDSGPGDTNGTDTNEPTVTDPAPIETTADDSHVTDSDPASGKNTDATVSEDTSTGEGGAAAFGWIEALFGIAVLGGFARHKLAVLSLAHGDKRCIKSH